MWSNEFLILLGNSTAKLLSYYHTVGHNNLSVNVESLIKQNVQTWQNVDQLYKLIERKLPHYTTCMSSRIKWKFIASSNRALFGSNVDICYCEDLAANPQPLIALSFSEPPVAGVL